MAPGREASTVCTGTTSTISSNPKSVSVPNLSSTESSSMSTSANSVFSSPLSPNNLNNVSSSLFDSLSAIARVRSLINSSRFPSASQSSNTFLAPSSHHPNSSCPSASNPSQNLHHSHHHHHQNPNQSNNPFLFGRAPVSSLVRIALSSNFPGDFHYKIKSIIFRKLFYSYNILFAPVLRPRHYYSLKNVQSLPAAHLFSF